jgi:hypothetical protein
MAEVGQTSSEQAPKDLIGFLDFYLVKKAPFQIPDNAKEWLVQYGPWITIVIIVLTLPAVLALLGLGAVLLPFAGYGAGFGLLAIGLIVEIAMTLMALPGLFARKMSGWTLLFYSRLVSIAARVLAGAIVSAVVGGLISLYILFQVRSLYKS